MEIQMEVDQFQDIRVKMSCTMTIVQWEYLSELLRRANSTTDVFIFGQCILNGLAKIKAQVSANPMELQ